MIGGSEPAVTSHEFHDESREAAKETLQQGTTAGRSDREEMYTCRNPVVSHQFNVSCSDPAKPGQV